MQSLKKNEAKNNYNCTAEGLLLSVGPAPLAQTPRTPAKPSRPLLSAFSAAGKPFILQTIVFVLCSSLFSLLIIARFRNDQVRR